MKSKKELKDELASALNDTGVALIDADSSNFLLDYETGVQYTVNHGSLEKRTGKYYSVRINFNFLQKIIITVTKDSEHPLVDIPSIDIVEDEEDLKEWLGF